MKFMPLRLGFRYLVRYRRLYSFLFFALLFCFAVISAVAAIYSYMSDNVYSAAQLHYGGDVFILGFDKKVDGIGYIGSNEKLQSVVAGAGLSKLKQVYRTNLQRRGTVYFNGKGIMQKNIFGIDIANELDSFKKLDFAAGSADSMLDSRKIFLSSRVADKLGAKVGDDIVVKTPTVSGQINTGNFVIGGIIRDNSIFGYFRCFMDRRELNRLVGLADGEYSSLGLINTTGKSNARLSAMLYNQIALQLPHSDHITRKEELTAEMGKSWKNLRYFAVSLNVFVSEVISILEVLELVSYFLYAMLLLITLGSSIITVRLILNERSGELGVMKALGLWKPRLHRMLLTETFILIVLACSAGFLVSLLILKLTAALKFGTIPGFDVFLRNNVLSGKPEAGRIFLNIGVIFCIVLPSVSFSIRKVLNEPCVKLLSGAGK